MAAVAPAGTQSLRRYPSFMTEPQQAPQHLWGIIASPHILRMSIPKLTNVTCFTYTSNSSILLCATPRLTGELGSLPGGGQPCHLQLTPPSLWSDAWSPVPCHNWQNLAELVG